MAKQQPTVPPPASPPQEDFALRDDIFTFDDTKYQTVAVPEWKGKKIRLRCASATEYEHYLDVAHAGGKMKVWRQQESGEWKEVEEIVSTRALLVTKCAIDASGKRMFKDSDAGALGVKHAGAITRLFMVCQDLSSLEDVKAEGNSLPTEGGASSPSGSPGT